MADGTLIDLFDGKHREFLNSMSMVWVGYDKRRDRLRIRIRCNDRLPPTWLRQLSIIVRHDRYSLEETLRGLDWPDLEGSLLVVTSARPIAILPERPMSEEVLPIGDVILFSGNGAYEHPLYNEMSDCVMSRNIVDSPRTLKREDCLP